MTDYDIITIGGGLGGAALARAMAERGSRVLVLERETKFKDRVRGEGMTPWGVGEARELGILDVLKSSCGREVPVWDTYIGPMQVAHRELPSTTPQGLGTLTFYHPEMQQTLLDAAAAAGAEVRRGARAKDVKPGQPTTVAVENADGSTETLTARMVVAADGRGSMARKWGGFEERRDKDRLQISGLFFEDSNAPDDTVRLIADIGRGCGAIVFPQGEGRMRAYWISGVETGARLQGDKDVPRFIEESVKSGMPQEYFEGARATGPLATFEGADCYVAHPYREGIALIGDAAASSDPSWGQGLSLTMRDVRVLRDELSATTDWDAAGHAYAKKHDEHFGIIHEVEDWFTRFFFEQGPDADARRARAFPQLAQDPARQPDDFFTGPNEPADDRRRRRFFGEE